jgi:hypothetical protein
MWFDDFEPVHPQISFNALGDDPRVDHINERAGPAERWPLASDFDPFAHRPSSDDGMMHFRSNDGAAFGLGRREPDTDVTVDTVLKSSLATEPEPEPIVVTGTRLSSGGLSWTQTGGGGGPADDPMGDTIKPPPLDEGGGAASDESEITITVQIYRTLSASEQQVLQNLQNAIAAIDAAIRSLADNARITLYDGSTVTGAELKALWSKTDFTVNPDNTYYGTTNPQNRGAAILNGGDPQVFVNMWVLQGYAAHPDNSGLNYFVGHELGHLVNANQTHNGTISDAAARYEQMANDISRAIANLQGLAILPQTDAPEGDAYDRYSTPSPLIFTTY